MTREMCCRVLSLYRIRGLTSIAHSLAQSLAVPPTDDAARTVIRQAMTDSNGFVGQEKGAEIVRLKIPGFPKKRAMQLVKELTGNDKPGPKGPRKKSCG